MRDMKRRPTAASLAEIRWRPARVTRRAGSSQGSSALPLTPRTRLADVLLPLVLAVVLALVTIGLSPATARLGAGLENLPCGP